MMFDVAHGNVVYLFAHPDDEFACSMPIRAQTRRGVSVHCVFTTDGGHGGQSVFRRQQESRRVLARLGVPCSNIHFLGEAHGFPDGGLHKKLAEASLALESCFEQITNVRAVALPAWEGGHQDHDATHLIGVELTLRLNIPLVRQFPLYNGAGLPGPLFKVMAPLCDNGPVRSYRAGMAERLFAVMLCFHYVSQWKTWVGLLPFFTWHLLTRGTFPEQDVSLARIRETPHPGSVLYERRGFLKFSEFNAEVEKFLAARSPDDATVRASLE